MKRNINTLTKDEIINILYLMPLVKNCPATLTSVNIFDDKSVTTLANKFFMNRVKEVEDMNEYEFGTTSWFENHRELIVEKVTDYIYRANLNRYIPVISLALNDKMEDIRNVEITLSNILGCNIENYDLYIDDGCDDDDSEDRYVMCAAFHSTSCENPITIRLYYGDQSRSIGYIEVAKY